MAKHRSQLNISPAPPEWAFPHVNYGSSGGSVGGHFGPPPGGSVGGDSESIRLQLSRPQPKRPQHRRIRLVLDGQPVPRRIRLVVDGQPAPRRTRAAKDGAATNSPGPVRAR